MTGRDWDVRGARLTGLRFAAWLLENDGSNRHLTDQYEDLDEAWLDAQANRWVETVHPKRQDSCSPGYKPYPWPKLTASGRIELDRARSLRNNPQARAEACREALLLWLRHEGRGAASADLIVARDDWRFYDDPFTTEEVNEAGKFLVEKILVSAVPVWGPDIVRPELTAAGLECVDFFHADLRKFLLSSQPGASVTNNQQNNFYGGNAQASQGDNNTQTQNIGLDAEALAAIFQPMRDALPAIEDADERSDVEHAIHELEAAAADGDLEQVEQRTGRLKRLIEKVGSATGKAALGAAATVGIKALFVALGIPIVG